MRTKRRASVFFFALAVAAAPLSWAEGLPAARPESVGLSAARLLRINETMKRYVDEGKWMGRARPSREAQACSRPRPTTRASSRCS